MDLIVKTKTLGKPKNSYSPIDLSVLDRTLAAKLILYPSIIGEAAEKLNIGVLEEYIKTIVQLIKPNDSTSINSIENVTVHDTLQLVVQDISEILTT